MLQTYVSVSSSPTHLYWTLVSPCKEPKWGSSGFDKALLPGLGSSTGKVSVGNWQKEKRIKYALGLMLAC
jgi:hypothetical protein